MRGHSPVRIGDAVYRGARVLLKTANYAVNTELDSGSYICADNSQQVIYFTLPPVNSTNGLIWDFSAVNTGKFEVIGDTNALVSRYGVVQKAINFGNGRIGDGCRIFSSGEKYYPLFLTADASAATANIAYQDG